LRGVINFPKVLFSICYIRLKYSSQKDRKIDDDKQRQTSDDEDENNDEEDDDDSVDSDFSIDEDDEPRSDLEDEAKAADALNRTRPKRGQGVQTKAYKEPKRDKDKKIIRNERALATLPTKDKKKSPSRPQLSGSGVSSPKSKVYTVSGHSKPIQSTQELLETGGHRKLTRATTVTKTAETAKRQKERLLQHRKLLKRRAQLAAARKDEMRPLTQAEILEEAKITEKLNLESLKRFQEMELEARKKARNTNKRSLTGPYISYVSTSMPLIQEVSRNGNVDSSLGGNSDDRICVDDEYEDEEQSDKDQVKEEIIDSHTDSIHSEKQNEAKEDDGNEKKDNNNENEMQFRVDSRLKQERTFVTFSDFDTFRNSFPGQKRKEPVRQPIQQKVCPITRLPAKYFDPVTRLPYANLQAFRILREAYYTQLELKGDRNDPEIKEWIEWRQKCKGTNVLSNKNSVPVSKSNVIQQLPNANTPSSVLLHVSRPPAAFSHLLATNNPASTNVISQQSNPVTTTLPSSISSPNIVLKSQVVSNSLANTAANMNNTVVCTPTLANQQITTLTTSGNIQQGTVMTTTTPQRGLSALAVAVRQQHLQHQQQQLLQQQQQQIIANFVTTISPVSANAYLTTVTSTQSQNRAATGVQVVASSAR
jgi:vacuolar protein sorting-associated protein 72